jgi:hypothetical protein
LLVVDVDERDVAGAGEVDRLPHVRGPLGERLVQLVAVLVVEIIEDVDREDGVAWFQPERDASGGRR